MILPVAAIYGVTAIGWNGVQISEVTRRAPPGKAALATGGSGFITFGGVMIGPMIFGGLAAMTGGYRVGFALCATVSAVAALFLLRNGASRDALPPSM